MAMGFEGYRRRIATGFATNLVRPGAGIEL